MCEQKVEPYPIGPHPAGPVDLTVQPIEEGRVIVSNLIEKLGVNESDLVPYAYADLLLNEAVQGAAADEGGTPSA